MRNAGAFPRPRGAEHSPAADGWSVGRDMCFPMQVKWQV